MNCCNSVQAWKGFWIKKLTKWRQRLPCSIAPAFSASERRAGIEKQPESSNRKIPAQVVDPLNTGI
jgi:hypothetical protein